MVSQAKTMLSQKESDLSRIKPLAEMDAVSKRDLDMAQAQRDAAISANANLELSTLKDELQANDNMVKAASNASYLSRQRYYQGVTSYLEVIENQGQEFDALLQYSNNYRQLLTSYINLYKSLGGGWILQEEIDIYAQQLADEQEVDVATINKDSLFYAGQIVDLVLTPEQKQAKKDVVKTQRKLEREQKKTARQNK